GVDEKGSAVSQMIQRLLEDLLVQRHVSQRLLQTQVLLLKLLQPPGGFGLHPAVLVAPAVEGLLADAKPLADLSDRLPRVQLSLGFAKLADDLFRCMSLALHRESP